MLRAPTYLENIIDERAEMTQISPETLDRILSEGWRLLGYRFLRHNLTTWQKQLCNTIPLRVRLADFDLSKSQRKILRQNEDLRVVSGPAQFDEAREGLFSQHEARFAEKQSTTLASFLHRDAPHAYPTEGRELAVYLGDELIACSFFHWGKEAVSGTYCVFSPEFNKRSLGTFTMLLEILLAKERGMAFYYHGYVHNIPSQFDYKLNLSGLEAMSWKTSKWEKMERIPAQNWRDL